MKRLSVFLLLFVLLAMPLVVWGASIPRAEKQFVPALEKISTKSIMSYAQSLTSDESFYAANEIYGTGFKENFSDASDWTTDLGMSITGGANGGLIATGAGASGYVYKEFSATDYYEYHYEFQVTNASADTTFSLSFYSGSSWYSLKSLTSYATPSNVYGTYRGIISSSYAQSMTRIGFHIAAENQYVTIGYLRLSPWNQGGWTDNMSSVQSWSGQAYHNSTPAVPNAVLAENESLFSGSLQNLFLQDGANWYEVQKYAGEESHPMALYLNFSLPALTDGNEVYGFQFACYYYMTGTADVSDIQYYNQNNASWTTVGDVPVSAMTWANVSTTYNTAYWAPENEVIMRFLLNASPSDLNFWLDYAEVQYDIMVNGIISNGITAVVTGWTHLNISANGIGVLNCTIYPFLAVNISDCAGTYNVTLDDSYLLTAAASNQTGVLHFYLPQVMPLSLYSITVELSLGGNVSIGGFCAYNIANFTTSISGTPTTDTYLYVENGILYGHLTTGSVASLSLWEPSLSVDTSVYKYWYANKSTGSPDVNFYVGSWSGYTENSNGTFSSGTLTNFKFTMAGNDAWISSMQFLMFQVPIGWHPLPDAGFSFQVQDWNAIGEAIFSFMLPIDEAGINMFFVVVGIALLPTSTVYIVYGGRRSLSRDKVFVFLILICLAFGLIAGGVAG
jgi:hypothetical protein